MALESRLRRHPRWRRTRALTGQLIDIQLRGLRVAVADAAAGLCRRERAKAAVLAIGEGVHPGAGQFGTLTVRDDGTGPVTVDLAGRDWTGRVLTSYIVTMP